MVTITYGLEQFALPVQGFTVNDVAASLPCNMPDEYTALINGAEASSDSSLVDGDDLELMKSYGSKGMWERPWCHAFGEEPPSEFAHGPVVGSLTQLSSWLTPKGSGDRRWVRTLAWNNEIWVRKFHERLYEVWVRSESRFKRAVERLASTTR